MKKNNLKRVISVALALFIMTTTSSLTFAKGRNDLNKHNTKAKKSNYSSLQKSLKSIAPKSTTSAAIDLVIAAQIETVKKAYTNCSAIAKQVNTKKSNTSKLIMQIRKGKKTLTSDQYKNLNSLIASINTEAKKIVNIKGINNVIKVVNAKKASKAVKVTSADLTAMLNSINANTTHLNTISATYDMINATLTTVANTTPAAVVLK